MATIEKVLKAEIQRLARKEIKTATADLRSANAAHRSALADLKRRIVLLEKENARLVKQAARAENKQATTETETDAVAKARVTAKMIKSIRQRLGLSQAKFAQLIDVNQQSVYKWERKSGRLSFRGDVKGKIVAARQMTKKEADAKLNS